MGLIQPYISYDILIWVNTNSTTIQRIVSLQKRAIQIINHIDPLFKQL